MHSLIAEDAFMPPDLSQIEAAAQVEAAGHLEAGNIPLKAEENSKEQ